MKGLIDGIGKLFDTSLGHLIVLSLAIAALFLLYKSGASYLPNGGVGGAIKKIANAI